MDYNNSFVQIPSELRKTKGNSIKVAILDSGISLSHQAFENTIYGQNISSNTKYGILDKTGHGTHCAGIIGARKGQVIGIAPESRLYISKIITDKGNIFVDEAIKGLKWAIRVADVDVINMSFGINVKDNEEIKSLINEAYSKNTILVASAGENLLLKNEFLYPAMYDKCIAIGSIDSSFITNSTPTFEKKLDFIMPYTDILSCGTNNNYVNQKGSSMSAAFLTGIVSLIKASYTSPKDVSLEKVLEKLQNIAIQFNKDIDLSNPLQFIKP